MKDMNYFSAPSIILHNPSPFEIIEEICEHYNVTYDQLKSHTRERPIVFARHLAMFLILSKTGLSLKQTGLLFDRDHTTAVHARAMIHNYIQTNSFNKKAEIEKFINRL